MTDPTDDQTPDLLDGHFQQPFDPERDDAWPRPAPFVWAPVPRETSLTERLLDLVKGRSE